MNDLFGGNPPHPKIPMINNEEMTIPHSIKENDNVWFIETDDDENQKMYFKKIADLLLDDVFPEKYDLIIYMLNCVKESSFLHLFDTDLLEIITTTLEMFKFDDFQHDEIDKTFHLFICRCITPFIQAINEKIVILFEDFIIKNCFEESINLLKVIHTAIKLTKWVSNDNKSSYALQIILHSLKDLKLAKIPSHLAIEIARCLVISSFFFNSFAYDDLNNLKSDFILCITNILLEHPYAFGNSSTVECLKYFNSHSKNHKIIAPPLLEANEFPKFVSVNSILQLIYFILFSIHDYDYPILLKIASICPGTHSSILYYHPELAVMEEKNKKRFFTKCLSIKCASRFLNFEKIPNDLFELAIFLNSPNINISHLKVLTKKLNKTISNIYNSIRRLPRITSDIRALISNSNLLSFILIFASDYFDCDCNSAKGDTNSEETHESKFFNDYTIVPYFMMYLVEKLSDLIVASPIFPHIPNEDPYSFLLNKSFEELAYSVSFHPKSFLASLLASNSTPGRVFLLTSTIAYIKENSNSSQRRKSMKKENEWKNIINANINKIVHYGLSILKIPSEITCKIASDFFVSIINYICQERFSKNIIDLILYEPVEMFSKVMSFFTEYETISNPKSTILFLGFLQRIISKSPIIKTFFILKCSMFFVKMLKGLITLDIASLSGFLASRAIQIIAALSDYGNSLQPEVNVAQRLIFDVIHHNLLQSFIEELNQINFSLPMPTQERSILVFSITQLLVSWCEPVVVTAYIANIISPNLISNCEMQANDMEEPFKSSILEMLSKVKQCFESSASNVDYSDFDRTQGKFPTDNPGKKLSGMFFSILDYIYEKQ